MPAERTTAAREWAGKNLARPEYAAAFAYEDGDARVARCYTVRRRTAQYLQDFAAVEGRTCGEIIDDALELYGKAAHPGLYG